MDYLDGTNWEILEGVGLNEFYEKACAETEEEKVRAHLAIGEGIMIVDTYEGSQSELGKLEKRYECCYVEGEDFDKKAMRG